MPVRTLSLLLLWWLPFAVATAAAPLTDAEKHWLSEQSRPLRVGIALVPPQQAYLNDETGKLEGLAIEYLDALEKALGVKFERVLAASYQEMMASARAREIDIVYAATRTAAREDYLDFTQPYNFISNHLFVRKYDNKLTQPEMLKGELMAVTAGTAVVEYMRHTYPEVNLVEVESSKKAFSMLAAGQVRAVGATASSAYSWVHKAGLPNIALTGSLGYQYAISFAGRNDWPQLTPILQKGLDAIPPARVEVIRTRWARLADENRIYLAEAQEYIALAFGIGMFGLVGGLFYWNRSLKREIGQRTEVENRLSYLAYHDEITGLTNRSGLLKQLEQLHQAGRSYGLVLLGLDQFRAKNELWGQQMGNELLREFARQLQRIRPPHSDVARVGGDEFVLLCPGVDNLTDAMLDELHKRLRRPLVMEDQSSQVLSASAGVVMVENSLERPELSLQQAEVALKYAKHEFRGSYTRYDATMGRDDLEDQLWRDELAHALDSGQLFLEYQPQLDLRQRRVVGFEALVRWQHPERGRISPADFIPLAERTGLIGGLGDWVLRTACQQACDWRQQGLNFDYVAVNVSVRQFVDAAFARKVYQVLSDTDLPAHCLELEITETLFMNDFETVRTTLNQLHGKGIRFSIDDFGTGFSSLLYLKELPVGTLKLAQEFVLDIAENSSSRSIVNAATRLGHSLGMRVIAEGVEGEREDRLLHQLECDMVQGYYYSRPVPVERVNQPWLDALAEQSGRGFRESSFTVD